MPEAVLVLLISEDASTVQSVREALTSGAEQVAVQHVERVRTAIARIGGGGVAVVVLDISSANPEGQRRDACATLRAGAPEVPVVLLCEAEDEPWAAQMAQQGGLAYVLRPNWQRDLKHSVLALIARQQATALGPAKPTAGKGTVIAVMGAKGGVGATTVSVNLAAVLASTGKVILVELRPAFGTLCHFFRPHRSTRGLRNLLAMSPADIGVAEMESCLWPNRSIPGLSVLFAPEKPGAQELEPDHARTILGRLSELGDVVVVDLPQSLSAIDRAILERSDTLILAVERDALSVDAAKSKLSVLEEYGIVPREAGLVIVNRVPLAAPIALAEIESQFGMPTFGVIPPAADLCASAYRVHTPVVNHDAQSLMAASLVSLAKRLSSRN